MSASYTPATSRPQSRRPSRQMTRQASIPRPQQPQSRRQSLSQAVDQHTDWSRRQSLSQAVDQHTDSSLPQSHYANIRQDILNILGKPEPNDAAPFNSRSQINLQNLQPYTRFMTPLTYTQMLVYGRLTLLPSAYTSRGCSLPKTVLLQPDSSQWPYLSPIRISVGVNGLPVDQNITCAGLGGVLAACSYDTLREGIFVFIECNKELDQQKLQQRQPEVVHVKGPPQNINVLMVGYSLDDSASITSHSRSSRDLYEGRSSRQRKLKWGIRDIRAINKQVWTETDAVTKDKEVLVCFRAAPDECGSDVKASYIRSIVARRST